MFYGIKVEFINDIGSGLEMQILRCLFRDKPSQKVVDKYVKDWVKNVEVACNSGKSLFKVSEVRRVKVIDFVLIE